MSYVESNLLPNEEIIYSGKIHTYYSFVAFILAFIGLILFSIPQIGIIAFGIMFIGIYLILYYWTTEIAVTNKRFIYKTGIIARNVFELQLHKVESANLEQTIFQRIIGAGLLKISGTGGHSRPIENLAEPIKLRAIIYEQIEKQTSLI